MSEHSDKDLWMTLDRRLSDCETKLSQLQRDYQRDVTQLTHEVKELTNRVNFGLSNSVHNVEKDNIAIKLAQSEQAHSAEKSMAEMRATVREHTDLTKLMVTNFDTLKLRPVQDDVSMIKKTFIYGAVCAFVAFVGHKGLTLIYDQFIERRPPAPISLPSSANTSHAKPLKSDAGHES